MELKKRVDSKIAYILCLTLNDILMVPVTKMAKRGFGEKMKHFFMVILDMPIR